MDRAQSEAGQSYRFAKRELARLFAEADLPFADEDALDLLLGLTGLTLTEYASRGSEPMSQPQMGALESAARRRLSGEPVDRILGWRGFYGRRFRIDNVLSPRGDTEVLLLAALDAVRSVPAPSFLDLGTGSGALALSLLCEIADATALATDRNMAALTTARTNADALQVSTRFDTLESDWYGALPDRRFDAVLSNPPYIDSAAMTQLEPEVARHDPASALHGGQDGLDSYRIIIPGSRDYLKPCGWLGVEIGFDQASPVQDLFTQSGFTDIRLRRDPAGLDRVIEGRLR